jgi:pyruvate kinase
MLPIFGVDPYVSDIQNTKENDIDLARNIALMKGYKHGDYAIVVAGYPVGQGSTNMMRIIQL